MAKTKLSDLGSGICVDDQNEKGIPALGDGTAIPGDLCGINSTNGRVMGVHADDQESFVGILKEDKILGTEVAPVAGAPCMLVPPKSKHNYRIRTVELPDDYNVGQGMHPSMAVGKMTIWPHFPSTAGLSLPWKAGDTVAEVMWA